MKRNEKFDLMFIVIGICFLISAGLFIVGIFQSQSPVGVFSGIILIITGLFFMGFFIVEAVKEYYENKNRK